MSIMAILFLVGTLTGPPAPEAEVHREARVPKIGLDGPGSDACGGLGRIGGPYRELSIRNAPDAKAQVVDNISESTMVWLCEADGDEWQGIVYASGEFQDIGDCAVSRPVSEPQPYNGPCQTGWVRANDIEFLAG